MNGRSFVWGLAVASTIASGCGPLPGAPVLSTLRVETTADSQTGAYVTVVRRRDSTGGTEEALEAVIVCTSQPPRCVGYDPLSARAVATAEAAAPSSGAEAPTFGAATSCRHTPVGGRPTPIPDAAIGLTPEVRSSIAGCVGGRPLELAFEVTPSHELEALSFAERTPDERPCLARTLSATVPAGAVPSGRVECRVP